MSRKRKKQQIERASVDERDRPSRRVFGRLGRILFAIVVVAGLLLASVPFLICKTPILAFVVDRCMPENNGNIQIGSASMGWQTPVTIHEIVVSDEKGAEIGRVDSIVTSKGLLGFLRDRRQLGTIRIIRPNLKIRIKEGGSNWEDVFAISDKAEDEASATGSLPSVLIEMKDGNVEFSDPSGSKTCGLQAINGSFDIGSSHAQNLTSAVAFNVVTGQQVGKGSVQFSTKMPGEDELIAASGKLKVGLTDVPLNFLEPLVDRLRIAFQVSGSANADLTIDWNREKHQIATQGRVDVANLEFFSPQLLHEAIQIQQVSFHSDVRCENDTLLAEQLLLESSIGNLSLTGNAPLDGLPQDVTIRQLISSIANGQAKLSGEIDVAALARTLPQTLKIREDTEVTGGQISLDLNAVPSENGVALSGYVHTSDLTALNRGREISWERPIQTDFQIAGMNHQFRIEKLTCLSTFFSLVARGDLNQGSLAARTDLRRFQNQFQQLFDFRESVWQGVADFQCRWKRNADDSIFADGTFHADHFQMELPGSRSIDERVVDGRFRSQILLDGTALKEIRIAACEGKLSDDRFTISLTAPIVGFDAQKIPLDVSVQGQLERWNSRLALLGFETPVNRLGGLVDLNAELHISQQAIEFETTGTTFRNLIVRTDSIQIDEPNATLSILGSCDFLKRQVTVPKATFTSAALSAEATNVRVDLAELPIVEGDFGFQGDLAHMERSLLPAAGGERFAGKIEGTTHLKSTSLGIEFDGDTLIRDLRFLQGAKTVDRSRRQYVPQAEAVWEEPTLRLGAKGIYESRKGNVALSMFSLQTESIGLAAKGNVQAHGGNTVVDIQGTAAYDLGLLAKRFRNQLGDQIEISGKAKKPFHLRGPLFSGDETTRLVHNVRRPEPVTAPSTISDLLKANAGFGWDKAKVYGLNIESGELSTQLVKRRLRFDPFQVQVGSGMVSAAPILDLRGPAPELIIQQGRVFENIELSPELCETWLKFVAPLVANATKAEGKFSVDVKSASIPFDRPAAARAGGTLAIHQGQVGPGSLSRRLLSIAEQLKSLLRRSQSSRIVDPERAWLTLPEQQVRFTVRNGQVGHQGLKMNLSDIPVETSGWVTVDERLNMEASFPIQKEWLGNDPLLSRLEGQTLTVPIAGTISRPQLDRRGFQKLTRQAATKAAEGILKDEIGNQLQRLFRQK